jgi:hypothetical protein
MIIFNINSLKFNTDNMLKQHIDICVRSVKYTDRNRPIACCGGSRLGWRISAVIKTVAEFVFCYLTKNNAAETAIYFGFKRKLLQGTFKNRTHDSCFKFATHARHPHNKHEKN